MKKKTVQFAIVVENGTVKEVGQTSILQPKTNYQGNGIKWYPDKYKEGYKNEKQ